jgi:peptide/nickel transport system ATP-binding protein
LSLLAIENLTVSYDTRAGRAYALDGATLMVGPGERVGVIGESGSGKTTLAMSIGRLLPSNARVTAGRITVDGRDVHSLAGASLRLFRSDELGYVFQAPVASLDPTKRISKHLQLVAGNRVSADWSDVLGSVGLQEPDRVLRSFPHELSGGMAQRVAIALALLRGPRLVIADEPTASLDAIVRRRVLEVLMKDRPESRPAVLLFTHDLATVQSSCDRVVVMYGGRVVEDGPRDSVFRSPLHPYTRALLRSAPGSEGRDERLKPIPGSPPVVRAAGGGCAFADRCIHSRPHCAVDRPVVKSLDRRLVVCHEVETIVAREADQVG